LEECNLQFQKKGSSKFNTVMQARGEALTLFLQKGCAASVFPEVERQLIESLCPMTEYQYLLFESAHPVEETGADSQADMFAFSDRVRAEWQPMQWVLFPLILRKSKPHKTTGKVNAFAYGPTKRSTHYWDNELPLRLKLWGRTGQYSADAGEQAQKDGRYAVHACASQPAEEVDACALARHTKRTSATSTQEELRESKAAADNKFQKKMRLKQVIRLLIGTQFPLVPTLLGRRAPAGYVSPYAELTAGDAEATRLEAEAQRDAERADTRPAGTEEDDERGQDDEREEEEEQEEEEGQEQEEEQEEEENQEEEEDQEEEEEQEEEEDQEEDEDQGEDGQDNDDGGGTDVDEEPE
jgi:hypothetical protein